MKTLKAALGKSCHNARLIKQFFFFVCFTLFFLPAFAFAENDTDQELTALNKKLDQQQQLINQLKSQLKKLQTNNKETVVTKPATTNTTNPIATKAPRATVGTTFTFNSPPYYDYTNIIANPTHYEEHLILISKNPGFRTLSKKNGDIPNPPPLLEIGGKLIMQAWNEKGFNGHNYSDVNVDSSELVFTSYFSQWVQGLVAIDDNFHNSNINFDPNETPDLDVKVSRAFIALGNLQLSPYYATIGRVDIPYGHYLTYMISQSYPYLMFRTKEDSLLVGASPPADITGPHIEFFAANGKTETGGNKNNLNNFGVNVGYQTINKIINNELGVSAINNIANADGMQANGLTNSAAFRGFDTSPSGSSVKAEQLQRAVPGLGLRDTLFYKNYIFIIEANTATSSFANQDLSYNNHGAKPAAGHIEAVYRFNMGDYASLIAAGYDHAWQSIALNIPQSRYIATFSTSLAKYTIESLQLRRDINYASSDVGGGQDTVIVVPGHISNSIIAQIGIYF